MTSLLPIAAISVLMASATDAARAQQGTGPCGDTLDPCPEWCLDTLRSDIVGRLRWPSWARSTKSTRDSLLHGVVMRSAFDGKWKSMPPFTTNEEVRLLSWREMMVTSRYAQGSDTAIHSETHRQTGALLIVTYSKQDGSREWAVICAVSFEPGHWDPGVVSMDFFDHAPSSREIYEALSHRREEGLESNTPWFYYPRPYRDHFLAGAVRVNTWKEVTGEAPTLFFANEK